MKGGDYGKIHREESVDYDSGSDWSLSFDFSSFASDFCCSVLADLLSDLLLSSLLAHPVNIAAVITADSTTAINLFLNIVISLNYLSYCASIAAFV